MPYANKLLACSQARRVLGVDKFATKNEVREAWRQRAMETHPDRPRGSIEAFQEVNDAYELLIGEAPDTRWSPPVKATYSGDTPNPPLNPARIFTQKVELSPLLTELCQNALGEGEAPRPKGDAKADEGLFDIPPDATYHVPSAVRRKGRKLSYIVSSALKSGANRVALPTGTVTGRRNDKAEIVSLNARNDGKATVEIPEHVRKEKFPGASQVRIHFGKE